MDQRNREFYLLREFFRSDAIGSHRFGDNSEGGIGQWGRGALMLKSWHFRRLICWESSLELAHDQCGLRGDSR